MQNYQEVGNKKATRKLLIQTFILSFNILFGILSVFSKNEIRKNSSAIILFCGNSFFSIIYILVDYHLTLIKVTDFSYYREQQIDSLENGPVKLTNYGDNFSNEEYNLQNNILNSNKCIKYFTKFMFCIGVLHENELKISL
jgi:hypothetical protein